MNKGVLGTFSHIVLFIYILFIIGNLYMILKKNEKKEVFFNILSMPLLTLFYFLKFKNHDNFIYISLILFWFADILFTKKNKKNIILGIILYILGIFFYIIKIATLIKILNLNYLFAILIILLYTAMVFFEIIISYEYVIEYFKKGKIIINTFLILNAIFCVFTILLAISNYKKEMLYVIIGSNLFLISNNLLLFKLLIKNNRFLKMSTTFFYAVSQLLFILGLGLFLSKI